MLLSICTSFYNVENYIASFIHQLKDQTNPEFECILVDDGSTDKSYENCKKAINGDSRFKIIKHKKNIGLGAGRVTGIEQVNSEYVTFMDPDDEIENTAIEIITKDIKTHKYDFIIYDYFSKNEKSKIKLISSSSNNIESLFSSKSPLISHVWHKVYKKELLQKIDFTFYKTISFAEDLWLCINCFLTTQHPIIIHKPYYYYKYNSNSMVHNRTEKSIRENIAVLRNLLMNPKLKKSPEIEQYIKNDSFHAFGHLIFPNKNNSFQKEAHFREWKKLDSEINIFVPKNISKIVRLYISCIRKENYFLSYFLWFILKIKQFFFIIKRS